jgi:hypothetical protein
LPTVTPTEFISFADAEVIEVIEVKEAMKRPRRTVFFNMMVSSLIFVLALIAFPILSRDPVVDHGADFGALA